MTSERQLVVGKALVVLGCLWLCLLLFRIPPLFAVLFILLTRLGPRAAGFGEILLTIVAGREYVMAVATAALGVLVWRRAALRRWPLRLILAGLALSIIGGGLWYGLKNQGQRRREAAYEQALSSYRQTLQPGMTRKQVEDYLRGRNARFEQMCCVEGARLADRASWDDLVKIGQEKPPWFCNENYVYIAFQFIDHMPPTGISQTADDLNTLKSVTIYRQLGGCL
jgi:hypothetical protein